MDLFVAFRGRKPNVEPLLRQNGLLAEGVNERSDGKKKVFEGGLLLVRSAPSVPPWTNWWCLRRRGKQYRAVHCL